MPIASGLLCILATAYSALAIGSVVRLLSLYRTRTTTPVELADARRGSLLVWWVLLLSFTAALLFGQIGLATFFCVASLFALNEFFQIFQRQSTDRPILRWTIFFSAIAHYAVLGFSSASWTCGAFAIVTLLLVTLAELATGQSKNYLLTSASYFWASMLIVFGLSHAVMTIRFPATPGSWSAGGVGWCIYLVLLTETNDISQALIGRKWGKHRVTPTFSPGKTWEGFIGGILLTMSLAIAAAPWLTTLTLNRPVWQAVVNSAGAGVCIALAGFLGDVNISGLKREAGIKDSGNLLPGMGGMLDRVDSLTFAAPAFYYFVTMFN